MAFYPTWQTATATADPSQTWQNQFIQQQIPATNGGASVTAIAPLNSLDFQPQVIFIKILSHLISNLFYKKNRLMHIQMDTYKQDSLNLIRVIVAQRLHIVHQPFNDMSFKHNKLHR